MYCPLKTNQAGSACFCDRSRCAFSDAVGDCLIKQALQCYVSEKRSEAAREKAFNNYMKTLEPNEPWEYDWGGVD